ncbi:MAG TPA: 4-alpha-glucanotransferase [Streptosporangiaceae bacterium]
MTRPREQLLDGGVVTSGPGEGDHGGVTDPGLIRRAEAAGISTSYENWLGEPADVPADTLEAILAALAAAPANGTDQAGTEQTGTGQAETGQPDPGQLLAPRPDHRSWGFTVQLYSVRSRQSWGHGDLRDLAELAAWSGRALGAGFILVNPLHAAEPQPPVSPSPYLPMTRRYTSPLYLRIEDIPECARLSPAGRAEVERLAAPLRARSRSAGLIDRDEVWAAKRAALQLIWRVPLDPGRRAALAAFREREGAELEYWSAWCALAERHGPDWRSWPASLRTRAGGLAAVSGDPGAPGGPGEPGRPADPGPEGGPGSPAGSAAATAPGRPAGPGAATGPDAAGALGERAGFHAWLQWLVDEQLAAAQQAALGAGMAQGVLHDLAVGVHPGGADAWAHQDLLVAGMSVGAPPDSFNQRGQDWAQPPWHPQRLAAAGYRPLADLFAAALRHSGGLRADHVMGLFRLWWVPDGMTADRGAYVRYDHAASVAALAGQARAAGGLAVGEDLGTVAPWIRPYLAGHGVLGTMMLWFAEQPDGSPLPPGQWRADCMATVGTHDVPTVAGFASGDQVGIRARLGLLTSPEEQERARAAALVAGWRAALEAEGLIAAGQPGGARADGSGAGGTGADGAGADGTGADSAGAGDTAQLTVALYRYLARTPALLLGVSLADAVGETRSQNIPGTSTEYPNWQIPLCDEAGRPVLIEDLPARPLVRAVAAAVAAS